MPITLIVRLPDEKPSRGSSRGEHAAQKLTFDGSRIVLGRGEGSDLRLPDPSISHRHASLRAKGPDYTIVDENSTNGTFLGGVRLSPQTPRAVKSGDMLRVGRVWIEVRIGELVATPDLAMATRDLALALVSQAMAQMGDDTAPKIRVVEGPDLGAELRLDDEGRAYIIGRGEKCDLLLADPDASREHAQVTRRGGTVLIRDLGAKNRVFLAESAIASGRDVAWRSPQMVRLAGTVLSIEEPVALALADLESSEDEVMKQGEEPKPPAPKSSAPPPPPSSKNLQAPPGGASASGTASAPIASLGETTEPAARRKKKRGLSATDALVVVGAIAVIAMSALALVWLLKG